LVAHDQDRCCPTKFIIALSGRGDAHTELPPLAAALSSWGQRDELAVLHLITASSRTSRQSWRTSNGGLRQLLPQRLTNRMVMSEVPAAN